MMTTVSNLDENLKPDFDIKFKLYNGGSSTKQSNDYINVDEISVSPMKKSKPNTIDHHENSICNDMKINKNDDYNTEQNWNYIDKNETSFSMNPDFPSGKLTLWQFLLELLMSDEYTSLIKWTDRSIGEFILIQAEEVAKLWGIRKDRNHRMNYDKLSRALRYYYQKNIIKKVHGHKFVYRFVSIVPEILQANIQSSNTSTSSSSTNHNFNQFNTSKSHISLNQSNSSSTQRLLPKLDQLSPSSLTSSSPSSNLISSNNNMSMNNGNSNNNSSKISTPPLIASPNLNPSNNKDFNSTLNAFLQAALISLTNNGQIDNASLNNQSNNSVYQETLRKLASISNNCKTEKQTINPPSTYNDSSTNSLVNNVDCVCGGSNNSKQTDTNNTTTMSSASSSSSSSTTHLQNPIITNSNASNHNNGISPPTLVDNAYSNGTTQQFHPNNNSAIDRQSLLHFSLNSINMQRLSQEIMLHSSGSNKSRSIPHHHSASSTIPQNHVTTMSSLIPSSTNSITPPTSLGPIHPNKDPIPSPPPPPPPPPHFISSPETSKHLPSQNALFNSIAHNFWQTLSATKSKNNTINHTAEQTTIITKEENNRKYIDATNNEEQPTDLSVGPTSGNNKQNSADTTPANSNSLMDAFTAFMNELNRHNTSASNCHNYPAPNQHTNQKYSQKELTQLIEKQLENQSEYVWMPIPSDVAKQFLHSSIFNDETH